MGPEAIEHRETLMRVFVHHFDPFVTSGVGYRGIPASQMGVQVS